MNSEASIRSLSIGMGSPQEIAAALPYLLGFHPSESLVCLWLRSGEVLVVQRADLPDPHNESEYVTAYLESARNVDCDEVLIVCVTRDEDRGLRLVRLTVDKVHVAVRTALVLRGCHVRSAKSGGHWRWISAEDRQRAARLFAALPQARTVRRSRREVERELEYDQMVLWEVRRVSMLDLESVARTLAGGDLTASKNRRLLRDAALTVSGRDLVMWWCAKAEMAKRHELLEALMAGLRSTQPGVGAHVACAAAAAAWMCGDGVRANAALERCLDEDPGHLMGRMLESAMGAALPPAAFAEMLSEIDAAVVGAGPGVVDTAGMLQL